MAKRRPWEERRAGSRKRDQVIKTGGKTMIRVPDGVELFQPQDKRHKFDILLYEVGEGNPCAEKGEWYYERTFWAHRVGADNTYYVCPLKTAGKPCPVCEDRAELVRDPDSDEKLVKSLRPSQRQMFLIHDRDDDETPVKLFEFNNWNFGKVLDELRQDAEEDEEHIIDFDDPSRGATLIVKFGKNPPYGLETRSIEFRPRSKPLKDEWMNHGICLDDLIVIPDYETLKKAYLQIDEKKDDDDDDGEDKPRRSRSRRQEKDEDDRDDDFDDDKEPDTGWMEEGKDAIHEDMGLVEIVALNKAKTKAKVEDDDGEVHTVGVDALSPVPPNPCKACRGSGKNSKGGECRPCDGTGQKKEEKKSKDDDEDFDEPDDKGEDTDPDDDIPFDGEDDKKEDSGDDDMDDDWD